MNKTQTEISEMLKTKLRRIFDSSMSTETAKECIEVALFYGWTDLAREMIVDLEEELTHA